MKRKQWFIFPNGVKIAIWKRVVNGHRGVFLPQRGPSIVVTAYAIRDYFADARRHGIKARATVSLSASDF
jgi:hypothetical protein